MTTAREASQVPMAKKAPPELKGVYRTLNVRVDTPGLPAPGTDRLPANVRETLQVLEPDVEDDAPPRAARPETPQQEILVAFLEHRRPFDDSLVDLFLAEMRAADPNDALFLHYYQQGSEQLEVLLLKCLDRYPTDRDLLYDLAFLLEYRDVKKPLISRYHRALTREESMAAVDALAEDMCSLAVFQEAVELERVRELLAAFPEKLAVVERRISQMEDGKAG